MNSENLRVYLLLEKEVVKEGRNLKKILQPSASDRMIKNIFETSSNEDLYRDPGRPSPSGYLSRLEVRFQHTG